jgi:hypothetical protein
MQLLTLPKRKRLTIDKQTIIVDASNECKNIDYNKIEEARGLLKAKKLKPTKIQRAMRSEWT